MLRNPDSLLEKWLIIGFGLAEAQKSKVWCGSFMPSSFATIQCVLKVPVQTCFVQNTEDRILVPGSLERESALCREGKFDCDVKKVSWRNSLAKSHRWWHWASGTLQDDEDDDAFSCWKASPRVKRVSEDFLGGISRWRRRLKVDTLRS